MLKAVWFACRVGVLVFAAIWVANRPGRIEISWLGYDINAHVGFVLLILFIVLLLALLIQRLFLGAVNFGKLFNRYREKKEQLKGYRALSLGMSAVAAGDSKLASYQASRVRKLLPEDKGLSILLEAQSARLDKNVILAEEKFEDLVKDEDTAFLGLRGLMLTAIDKGDNVKALAVAKRALLLYPRQPWVLRVVYDLELREQKWSSALETLNKAEKYKAIDKPKAINDRAALYIQQALEAEKGASARRAYHLLKRAHKAAPDFLPASIYLANYCAKTNKRKMGVNVVESIWKSSPHPELVKLWSSFAPRKKTSYGPSRLPWFERLVSLNPHCYEGQLAAANAAFEESLWGEMRQYLSMAEKLGSSPRIYRLWAQMEERLGNMDKANSLLEKATQASADKVWVCSETGWIYDHWTPVSQPQGLFNTIVWGFPQRRHSESVLEFAGKGDLMITG